MNIDMNPGKRGTSKDTIAAVATPSGTGGIAVIRLSGPDAFRIADSCWRGRTLSSCGTHTAHLGELTDAAGGVIDQTVATLFRGPGSFTGEDTVEFSVHGSPWIQRRALDRLVEAGARPAGPGEFSMMSFLNGKIDLAQAEGIADLVAASSRAAHRLAMSQATGIFSKEIDSLRERLLHFAAMLELELDFSEEEVEFADRSALLALSQETLARINSLRRTFREGRAFKEGVPVTIAGIPNAGKSTLLNRLLADERAIVSDIPGTTRDLIEDTREIGGILFRFTDTAGLRETDDVIESRGVDKARERILCSSIILILIDPTAPAAPQRRELKAIASRLSPDQHLLAVVTKQDILKRETPENDLGDTEASETGVEDTITLESGMVSGTVMIDMTTPSKPGQTCVGQDEIAGWPEMEHAEEVCAISAAEGTGIGELEERLVRIATKEHNPDTELIVTNARHADSLARAADALTRAIQSLEDCISADLVAQDVREAIHHLSELTGALTTPDLLHHLFSRFCIGK